MYAFLSNEASPELQNMVYDFFYGNRLTNAHNEWLTILVDIGVLGLVSYAGMMISVIRNFLHAGKKSMLVGACGFCVLAYTVEQYVQLPAGDEYFDGVCDYGDWREFAAFSRD